MFTYEFSSQSAVLRANQSIYNNTIQKWLFPMLMFNVEFAMFTLRHCRA